jgi:hypothetical protein
MAGGQFGHGTNCYNACFFCHSIHLSHLLSWRSQHFVYPFAIK